MRRRMFAVAGTALIVALAWAAAASVAGAQGVTFTKTAGACNVSATITGDGAARSGNTIVVPHKGEASYTAVVAVEGEDRPHNGDVWAETPIPGVEISIHDAWGGLADGNSDAGIVTWDIPSWVPGGIIITVTGFHNDEGASCRGSQDFTLDGGFMDSPVGPASAILMLLTGFGLLRAAGAGGPLLGGISGFFFGLSLALVLLLLSVLPLSSILVLLPPFALLLIGVLLGIWPPLGFMRRS